MNQPTINIITPWAGHYEFIPGWEFAVKNAKPIIIDTSQLPGVDEKLFQLAERSGGVYVRWEKPYSFAASCNEGLKHCDADIVVMLNNDVQPTMIRELPHWTQAVKQVVKDGALYGPELLQQRVGGLMIPFLSGWCIAATRKTWEQLGGFDEETYHGGYWEDNDLCYRAIRQGLKLVKVEWPLAHFGNGTAKTMPGAYDCVDANKAAFTAKVLADLKVAA